MNQSLPPPPPVQGAELALWRDCARRYRDFLRSGFGHERALNAVVSRLVATDQKLARSHARVIAENAITWTRQNFPSWFEGCD